MRRWASALVVAFVVSVALGGQGAAGAASGRIEAPVIGMDAPIVKVGLKNGGLAIGGNVHAVYTWRHGDSPCDPLGTTVYAGHAWRSGDGVADRWGSLKKGSLIKVSGCKFRVTKRAYWSAKRSIKPLFRVDGPPRIVLIGCKPDDYSKRTMVFARMIS